MDHNSTFRSVDEEKLDVKVKIEKAIKELDEGKGIPHDQVKNKFNNLKYG